MSLPAREEWIEIMLTISVLLHFTSLPAREEWIEIYMETKEMNKGKSLPAREEWIEISTTISTILSKLRLFPRGKSGLKL